MTAAADEVPTGVYHQRVKISLGANGSATDAEGGAGAVNAGTQRVTLADDDPAVVLLTAGNASLATLAGAVAGTEMQVDVVTSALPAGAATSAKQDTGNTSLASIDGKLATAKTADYDTGGGTDTVQMMGVALPASGGAVAGGTSTNPLRVDPTGTTTQPVSAASLPLPTGASTAANQATGNASLAAIETAVQILDDWDESDRAKVNPIAGQAGVAGGSGTTGATTQRVVLATDTTVPNVTGNIAHGTADSGNPVKIGGRCDTTFQAAEGDGDRVDALFDVYGVQFQRDDHPNKWSYHEDSSSALTDQQVQAAPGSGLSIYVTDVILSLGAATALNIFFEEGSTKVLGPYYLEAVNGRSIHLRFKTPKKITANTALTVTTSAALAHGLDVHGFIAP